MNIKSGLFRRNWFRIFVGGLAVFVATEQALKFTGNPNFFPTVILFGAFLVPVSFVAFIYERVQTRDISLYCLLVCFLGGGAVGIITAGVLEFTTLQGMSILGLFGVGFIEELSKLIMPTFRYFRSSNRTEGDGLLFGVAAGMGFAALETMGYGMVTLMQSMGNIGALQEILLLRGLLAPAGHAAWTGLVCAVIWRERERNGRGLFSLPVIRTFFLAVLLHALWNIFNSLGTTSTLRVAVAIGGNVIVAGVSLLLLLRRVRESIHHPKTDIDLL